jgi:hypothetical protein
MADHARGPAVTSFTRKYPAGEALKMLFARPGTSIDQPVYGEPPLTGFNWRRPPGPGVTAPEGRTHAVAAAGLPGRHGEQPGLLRVPPGGLNRV